MTRDKWKHTRFIAYHAYISSNISMKLIPSMENFLPLEKDRKIARVSDEQRQTMLIEYQEYLEKKNRKK